MNVLRHMATLVAVLGITASSVAVFAQDNNNPSRTPAVDADSAKWPLEVLTLKKGPPLEGLVLNENGQQLEFAEIVRPPGKPMYAIVRAVPQQDVTHLKRLDPDQRAAAAAWFEKFRRKAEFAAAQAESLSLQRIRINEALGWQYSGRWFDLASTADEASTRRVIVRLEQLFLAFRQVLPPRLTPSDLPSVLLYNHRDEYRDRLRSWGLTVNNPAFYASTQKTIVASCNLGEITRQTEKAARDFKEQEAKLREQNADLHLTLANLAAEMREKGFTTEEVTDEIRARRSQWETEQADKRLRMAEVLRVNTKRLEDETAAFFRRLAHEAFHAYVENFVYPAEEGRLPRWLNEGLAQVFEAAPLDVDRFRIDAPDPLREAALRGDLQSRRPLAIASVLTADEEQFLLAHDREQINRLYLYSWGLAWQLLFAEGALGQTQLDKYLAGDKAHEKPLAQFEELVGQPLSEWERGWREKWKK